MIHNHYNYIIDCFVVNRDHINIASIHLYFKNHIPVAIAMFHLRNWDNFDYIPQFYCDCEPYHVVSHQFVQMALHMLFDIKIFGTYITRLEGGLYLPDSNWLLVDSRLGLTIYLALWNCLWDYLVSSLDAIRHSPLNHGIISICYVVHTWDTLEIDGQLERVLVLFSLFRVLKFSLCFVLVSLHWFTFFLFLAGFTCSHFKNHTKKRTWSRWTVSFLGTWTKKLKRKESSSRACLPCV